jgi:hypothetical protein
LISNRAPSPPADQVSGFFFFILLQLISIYTVELNFNSLAVWNHACVNARVLLSPASDRAGLAGSNPAHMSCAGLSPKYKKIKKQKNIKVEKI